MDVSWAVVLGLGVAMLVGSVCQSVVGFGLAVIAAPFVVVLAPELMPGALLLTSLVLPSIELARHGARHVDGRPLAFALAGRLAMTPVGVWLVAHTSATVIALLVGVMVLVGVAASVWAVRLDPRPAPAFVAGLLTGISGTAASIGGPFFGLVLQREEPQRIRSTLAVFFCVGASVSLLSLGVAGQVRGEDFVAAAVWAPFVLLGLALAVPLRRRVRAEAMRRLVLAVAAVAGIGVILRSLLLG